MNLLIYTLYRKGNAGLSNLIMSAELGVVLAHLTGRVLVLDGNNTPVANVVRYDEDVTNAYPSRVTDLIDFGVPWIDHARINHSSYVPHEITDQPPWECVFYFPASLSSNSRDIADFAGRRKHFVTVGEDIEHVPALSYSAGPENLTLGYYSYVFYLDETAQRRAFDVLQRTTSKPELAEFADRIATDLGPFNAVHIRRGDFKATFGVTTLERTPDQALAALEPHFSSNDRLVILTDEASDPFFEPIKAAYKDHVFLDHHILDHYRREFLDLPAHDSIALAYLSQLIAAQSNEFIGTMTSTYTGLIQRMRGNQGKDERFKFLWNELPDPGSDVERGRHAPSDCIRLENGVMVEDRDGPYSWNRFAEHLNPAWMREWPEGILDEDAMVARTSGRILNQDVETVSEPEPFEPEPVALRRSRIGFRERVVSAGSNMDSVAVTIDELFESMIALSDDEPIAELLISGTDGSADLTVDGRIAASSPVSPKLIRTFYREVVCQFIDAYPTLVWLHAASVSSASGTIVLPGPWGHGKTSLALELNSRGWLYLSDDIAPLDPATGKVHPFPATPQVRPKIDQNLPRERLGAIAKSAKKISREAQAHEAHELSMIVFPQYLAGTTAELSPLSPAQAVGQLLENCLSFAKNEDETIRTMCALVERIPVYSLDFDDVAIAAGKLIDAYQSPQRHDHADAAMA